MNLDFFGKVKRLTMQLVQVARLNTHVLIMMDTTTIDCLVNIIVLDNFGTHCVMDFGVLQLTNGEEVDVEGYSKLYVKIQQYHGHLTCVVNKLHNGTKLILGDGC
jgi:hypothetical protein